MIPTRLFIMSLLRLQHLQLHQISKMKERYCKNRKYKMKKRFRRKHTQCACMMQQNCLIMFFNINYFRWDVDKINNELLIFPHCVPKRSNTSLCSGRVSNIILFKQYPHGYHSFSINSSSPPNKLIGVYRKVFNLINAEFPAPLENMFIN